MTVPSRVGDDALGIVPVDEYERVFSFPTVGKDSELCVTRCHGFWLTFYVDDARSERIVAFRLEGISKEYFEV